MSGGGAARAALEWTARTGAEYRSAAVTAEVLHLAIALGLPRPLLDRISGVVADELDHAALSRACAVALGAEGPGPGLELDALAPPRGPPLPRLVALVLRELCVGETLAVPLFQALRAQADHPACRPALDRVLRDEANHRQLGWELLDALIELDPAGVVAFCEREAPRALVDAWRVYGELPDADPPVSAAERAAGLMPSAAWREVARAALRDDLLPRLQRRGICRAARAWPW